MKTHSQFQAESKALEGILGFDPLAIGQQSPQWHAMKLGVQSASKAKEILSGAKTATKRTFICSLVAQIATGERPEINGKALDWGNSHEDAARAAYEFELGKQIVELPFVYGDSTMKHGCSPDGLIFGYNGVLERGVEIKCPFNSENFIKFACDETVKKEHEKQCQFSMFVTGAEIYDYGMFDPRMKTKQLHWYTYDRNEKDMVLFAEAIQEINHEVDKMLATLGLEFGDQWKRLTSVQAS